MWGCVVSDFQSQPEQGSAELEALEKTIFAARNYVAPSRDLRPRVLEAAKDAARQKRHIHRLWMCAAAASLLWIVTMPLLSSMSGYGKRLAGPSQSEMEHTAIEYANQKGYGINWGLVDAFLKRRNAHQEPASR